MNLKEIIKISLYKVGLFYPLYFLAKIPSTASWIKSGCINYAPHSVKMKAIESYLKRFDLSHFVETGTYYGDTLGYISRIDNDILCTSIELSEVLHQKAQLKFKARKNVNLIQGDSGKELPELLNCLSQPALFWLDGHYSSGITAKGDSATPISAELDAVLQHPIKQHVILIDDARCFDGHDGYPYLDDLLHVVRQEGSYHAEVSTDIIRLTPRQ
jgi:hypothetical protein